MNIYFVKLYKGLKLIANALKYYFITLLAYLYVLHTVYDIRSIKVDSNNKKNIELSFIGELSFNSKVIEESLINDFRNCVKSDVLILFSEKNLLLDSKEIINLNENSIFILESEEIKTGFAVIALNKNKDNLTEFEAIKIKQVLKKAGAECNVLCIRNDNLSPTQINKVIKKTAVLGFDLIIGFNKKLKGRRNIRTVNFNSTHIFYSLNRYCEYDVTKEGIKEGAIINIGLKKLSNKKVKIYQEGYIPVALKKINNNYFIKKLSHNYLNNFEDERQCLINIEKILNPLKNWEDMIHLKDIFNVLNETIPTKYKELMDFSINEICARTYELAPMNIFFFRQDFRDKNDGKPKNELWRVRLVIRALLRKSLFIFSYRNLGPFVKHIVIKDSIEAHISTMAWYRQRLSADFIGITGSVGKTSTKDMLYCVMSQVFNTGKSERNTNVQVKIGINMQRICDDIEIFIQEIGGGRPGGASRHSRMILPQVAVVTNIGTAHIGNYDSQEDLMRNKLQITDGMNEDGMLFLNKDDEMLAEADIMNNVTYFAVKNKSADYYVENLYEHDGITEFDIVSKTEIVHIIMNVLGEYNVLNAVCSFAIGKYYGMNNQDIANGISQFKTSGIRQNLLDIGGCHLFVDCYNASLDSVENSLTVIEKMELSDGGKRNAIIGDITGMGEHEEKINEEVADIIATHNKVDNIVCYGNNANEIVSKIKGIENNIIAIEEEKELEKWMKENITIKDITLFKGSSKMKLDERIDFVFGTNLADQRYIDESHFVTSKKNEIRYRIFESYVTVSKCLKDVNIVKLRERAFGKPIKKIGRKAFANRTYLKSILLNNNIAHIGSESFYNCFGLINIYKNETVKYIGQSAFENCISMKEIYLPAAQHIDEKAFKNCLVLEKVYIPNVYKIAEEQFYRCEKLRFIELGDKVEFIEKNAFAKCKSLNEVVIPKSVKRIKEFAFGFCDNLTRITLSNRNTVVEENAFFGSQNVEIVYIDSIDGVESNG